MTNPVPLTHSTGGGELDPTRHHILADGTGWSQWSQRSGRRPDGAPYPMPTRYGWGTPSCGQPPPWTGDVGNRDSCSREGGHDGPHAAITTDGRGAYSEWGLTPADRYVPEMPTPEPTAATITTTSGAELLPARHYVMPDGTGWGQLRGNTGTYSRETRYPDCWQGNDACGQEPPWAGLDPRPAHNTRCDRRRGHDGPHVAHSPITPGRAVAEWGITGDQVPTGWTRVGYIEDGDVYVAPTSESPAQPAQVGAPRRTTSSGGGDISDTSRFYVMPDGTGWGQVPRSRWFERMASVYLATGDGPECDQEPPWSNERPAPANRDRCHRPAGHDGPHACVDRDGMAYAEWNLPAPGTVVTPPSNLTHTTWGEPIPAWCAVTPTSWDSDGVSIGVPRDHRPAYGNCDSEFNEWECTRPEGHGGAHFAGGADNARCYAEWGVHPRTQTGHPTRADNAATAPTPRQPVTHTSWGAALPSDARILPDGDGWVVDNEYPVMPQGVYERRHRGAGARCGETTSSPGLLWHCSLPPGHEGHHIAMAGTECCAEWGMSNATVAAPATPAVPQNVTHTTWGARLPDGARRTPTAWSVLEDDAMVVPSGSVPDDYEEEDCGETYPRPSIGTWGCTLPPGHAGPHFARYDRYGGDDVLCVAEWGIETPTTPAPTPETPPEGYISIEALRRETRRLAIREGWCPQHHEPLRELGIEPLGQKFTGTITVTIPVTYEVIASMSRNPRDTISGVAEVMRRDGTRRRLDEALRAARLVGEGDRYARITAGGVTNVTVGEFTYVED